MLFVPPILDLDGQCGDWTREQLVQIDSLFVAAVETAFRLGLESPAAARATVSFRNGSRRLAEETAIRVAWDLLCSRKGEMAALEVLAFVRELCPNIDPAYVRVALEQRVQRGVGW
jgi:hypothetical protein